MTVLARVIAKSRLPVNIRASNNAKGAAKRKRGPAWLMKPDMVEAVFKTYDLYVKRTPLSEIVRITGMSVSNIYHYIDLARTEIAERFRDELSTIVSDQIAVRRAAIAEAYKSLDSVRKLRGTPQRTMAEAKILEVIHEYEKSVEQLLLLRDRRGNVDVDERDGAQQVTGAPANPTIVIDMRSVQVGNQDGDQSGAAQ